MAKEDEVVVFAWVIHESREARDATNKEVMSEQRMMDAMKRLKVDMNRMVYGGFIPFVGR